MSRGNVGPGIAAYNGLISASFGKGDGIARALIHSLGVGGGSVRVMVAGTSHSRGSGGGSPPLINTYNAGIWDQMIMASGRYNYVLNCAVGGSNIANCYSQIESNIRTVKPHIIFFDGPTNDLVASMTDAQLTAVMQGIERVIILCLKNGVLPAFGFTPPRNSYGTSIQKLLPLCMELCRYYQTPFFDFYSPLMNPVTGDYTSGLNVDATHLNATGRALIFQIYASAVDNPALAMPGIYIAPFRNIGTLGQWWDMLRNGAFLYQSTPGTPNNWTINTTSSSYTVTDDATFPCIGKTLKYSKGATGQQIVASNQAAVVDANHTIQVCGRIKASGLTPSSAAGWTISLDPVLTTGKSEWQGVPQNVDTTFCLEGTWGVQSQPGFTVFASDIGDYELNNITMWDKTAAYAIFTPGLQS